MTIDKNNYEACMLAYVDGELDDATTAALMQFLQANPEKQKELDLLRMTVLPAEDEIVFPGKRALHRGEDSRGKKVWPLNYYKWAAAAAVACIAWGAVFYLRPEKSMAPVAAETTDAVHHKVRQPGPVISPGTVPADIAVKERPDTKAPATNTRRGKRPVRKSARPAPAPPADDNKAIAHIPAHPVLPALPVVKVSPPGPRVKEPLAMARAGAGEDKQAIRHAPRQKDGRLLPEDKITDVAEAVGMAKESINNAITRKLSGLIDHVKENGIRIGKVTFAFNN